MYLFCLFVADIFPRMRFVILVISLIWSELMGENC